MDFLKRIIVVALLMLIFLAGCGRAEKISSDMLPTTVASEELTDFKIGVLVGAGGVEDDGFNESAWKGIIQYTNRFPNVFAQMVYPHGNTLEDRFNAAEDLITVDTDIVIALGSEYNDVIALLQDENPSVKFILVDGALDNVNENTVVVTFAEQEAGFLAGVVAALQSPNNKLGFIGGYQEPSIERYGLGFLAGIAYINEKFGTGSEVLGFEFQGSFNEVDGGRKLAKEMFNQGVDTLFVAARSTGIGVMNEAKARLERNEKIYIIGADKDQYLNGKIIDGRSVVLTSVVKEMDSVLYHLLNAYAQNKFPGGQTLVNTIANNGIGLEKTNHNLTYETKVKLEEIEGMIRTGKLIIPSSSSELVQMIINYGYKVNFEPAFR